MSSTIDYYAVLGLLPSAEDFLIRAAYRALAQRYHPDRFRGPLDEATCRMAEINEAYAVLSDPEARATYNRTREKTPSSEYYFGEELRGEVPAGPDPLETDWDVVAKFYPDIRMLDARLGRISWRLANTFRAYMLERKAFSGRAEIAAAMEREFLELYFGIDDAVIQFARQLIELGQRRAARALNRAVHLLGNSTDPYVIIQ